VQIAKLQQHEKHSDAHVCRSLQVGLSQNLVSTNGNDEANQLCFGSQSAGGRSTDTCGPISQFAWKQKYNLHCIFYIPTN
jgi:hypothetical protein